MGTISVPLLFVSPYVAIRLADQVVALPSWEHSYLILNIHHPFVSVGAVSHSVVWVTSRSIFLDTNDLSSFKSRVKALEAENARLRQDGASPSQDASEHEALRTQLRELTQREEALQERIRDLQAALLDSTSRGPSPATRSPMGLEPGASASVHQSTNLEADSDDESSSVSSTFIRPGGGMKDKSHGSVAFMVGIRIISSA